MKRLLPLALLWLAACEGMVPPGSTTAMAVPEATLPIDLASPPMAIGREGGIDPVTGLDRLAIVNLVPTTDGMRVYYREAATTPEQVAAVPADVCAAKGGSVVSANTREPEQPRELPGVRIMTVQCTTPATPATPT